MAGPAKRFCKEAREGGARGVAGDTRSHPLSRRTAGPVAPRSPRCPGDGASAADVVAGGHGNAPQACGGETPLPRGALACAEDPSRNRACQHRPAPLKCNCLQCRRGPGLRPTSPQHSTGAERHTDTKGTQPYSGAGCPASLQRVGVGA
ncbi:hypothetical protein Q4I28_007592 [Leishmania naiffi]|uniref:Uncharacterized protein n=1 Tax=Leishmania naiffi TaxID=5678 RepID=A0AAW3B909_9TRYP